MASRDIEPAAGPDEELRVSTLELFFDLVFVFTLTQLTGLLAHDPSGESFLRVILIFVVLFWMYGGYVWLTNQVPPDRPARRLLVILGMGAFFVCALAIPEAFDGGGIPFGLGYLLVILVHSGLWLQVYGAGVTVRFGAFNVVAALCVIAAGVLDGPAAYGLWVAAIAIQFITPRIAGRAAPAFPIRSRHFVERHGLLLIVALGESVVAIGIGIAGVSLDPGVFGAAVLGLALAAALWWAYFLGDEEGAERTMVVASEQERFGLAINAYFFSYIPILLGVITAAAGVERSIGRAAERLDHPRLLGIRSDPQRLTAARGTAPLENERHRIARRRFDDGDRAARTEEETGADPRDADYECGNERGDDGAAAAFRARRLGRQIPFNGHCASPCRRPKPQAFIMPTWQIEKSKRTGSTGSMERSEAVISAAMRHPGDVYRVSPRHFPRRITCVSRGTISFDAGRERHAPRSTASRRIIQRRNRFRRLQPLPAEGRGKK
jgi:low temperature requirement protein LtrA